MFRRPPDCAALRPSLNMLVAAVYGMRAITTCLARLSAPTTTLLGAASHLTAARQLLASLFAPVHLQPGTLLAAAMAEPHADAEEGSVFAGAGEGKANGAMAMRRLLWGSAVTAAVATLKLSGGRSLDSVLRVCLHGGCALVGVRILSGTGSPLVFHVLLCFAVSSYPSTCTRVSPESPSLRSTSFLIIANLRQVPQTKPRAAARPCCVCVGRTPRASSPRR
jgi:hypothetical protein